MFIISIIIIVSLILVLVGMYFLVPQDVNNQKGVEGIPFVSVLVAVRNEAMTIERCLEALVCLNYPKDKIEILIGNDDSTDSTEDIVNDFIKDIPNARLFNVKNFESTTQGKARVLSCLSQEMKGEYMFVTDADIKVNPEWINGLLSEMKEEVALVSGVTMMEYDGFFSTLQALDWIYVQAKLQAVEAIGLQVTAIGNNMAIRKSTYDLIGGYEKIPFSTTEDFALFCAVRENGFETKTIAKKETLAYTLPLEKFKTLLHQRKRWATGVIKVPKVLVAILLLHSMFFPAFLMGLWFSWELTVMLLVVKMMLQYAIIRKLVIEIGEKPKLGLRYFYWEIYTWLFPLLLMIYYALPMKYVWKGRKY